MNMREKIARAMYDASPFGKTEGSYDEQVEQYKRICLLLPPPPSAPRPKR